VKRKGKHNVHDTWLIQDTFWAPVLSVRAPIWALRTWLFSVDVDLGESSQLG
jgi:hypothetical protein